MPEPLVIAFVGDESAGLDLVSVLDRRLLRPVHLLSTTPDGLEALLSDERVDCVVCGSLREGALQRVVFAVADSPEDVPVFDASGDVAATPARLELHRLDPDADGPTLASRLLEVVLESAGTVPVVRGPFSYLAVDADGRIVDWDPELEGWTGWRPAEALGEELWDVLPAWRDTEFEEASVAVRNGTEEASARLFHSPSRKWFDVSLVGVGGGFECYVLDVTAFQNAGGKIEGTGARFEETLDRITDAFFALDNRERFVFLNSQAEFLLDVDAADVTGEQFWDVFPAAVTTTFYREFTRALERQQPASFEEYYTPLGRWFEVNAYPSSEGLSVFLRDVTEQTMLQRKLEQLHDVTRALVVAESDREIAEQTIEATEEVLGFAMVTVWRHDEVTERLEPLAWSDAIDERVDDVRPIGPDDEFIWEVYETGEPRVLGFVPTTTRTSHHPGQVRSELLIRTGEYGVLSAYADERDAFDEADVELCRILASTVESAFTRAERERQLARQNERLNEFASVVSHDLRNPINIAASHVELARLADGPTEHLDRIDDSLERMETLTEDLLARARGTQELERAPLRLSQAAEKAWEGVDTAGAKLELVDDASFTADPDRIQQLFENLFRNSVEHGSTSPGSQAQEDAVAHGSTSPDSQTRQDAGRASSSEPSVAGAPEDAAEHSSTSPGSQARRDALGHQVTVSVGPTDDGFYVADDGRGIPPQQRTDIFDQGVTHADGGTGYGLAIVADIVEGHGWRVSVTESADGGARFDIENVRSLEVERGTGNGTEGERGATDPSSEATAE